MTIKEWRDKVRGVAGEPSCQHAADVLDRVLALIEAAEWFIEYTKNDAADYPRFVGPGSPMHKRVAAALSSLESAGDVEPKT